MIVNICFPKENDRVLFFNDIKIKKLCKNEPNENFSHLIYIRLSAQAYDIDIKEKQEVSIDKFIEEIKVNRNQMYMVAFSILKNAEDAEDIVQEALLAAYEKLYTLKNDDKFKSWMMRIVVNQAKMHIRKNTSIVYMENIEDVVEKTKEGKNKDEDKDIWEIVLSLKSELSASVILYYAQGYSICEISKIMRVPPGTVKSRLSKARALLKKKLEEL